MAAADVFSVLPDDLLVRIIFFLPLRDAARTSLLSRRWRLLWLSTDALNVDSSSYGSDRPNPYSRSYYGDLQAYQLTERLLSDARSALHTAGRCPVTMLSLFVKGHNDEFCHDVMNTTESIWGWEGKDPDDLLVDLLAAKELRRIEELRLGFYSDEKEGSQFVYELDPAVLPGSILRVLDLDWSRFKLPRAGGGTTFLLPRLLVLRLRRCSTPMKDLEDFIRAAPILHSLDIQRHDFDTNNRGDRVTLYCPSATAITLASLGLWMKNSIELDAPCLRTFRYEGHLVDLSMKSPVPELARVELDFTPMSRGYYNEPEMPWFGPFWRFVRIFRQAKILRLKVPNIEGIAVTPVIGKDAQCEHLFTFLSLQRLELEVACDPDLEFEGPCDPGRREEANIAIGNLLQCCPIMNNLHIRFVSSNNHSGYRRSREPLPDFSVSLNLFERRYSKEITTMVDGADGSSEVADLPGLSGCKFDCLVNHLRNVKLEFEFKEKELNTFEICLAKFFAENCSVLESLQIDDGKQNFLGHIHWMVNRWRADALEHRKQMERDSVNA